MPFIADSARDNGLSTLTTAGETVYITSQEAANYTEASSTYKLATKTSASVGSVQDGAVDGRRVIVAAITDGTVNSNGTGSHWALCKDSATSALLAAGALSATQGLTAGNPFTLDAISITFRDAA